MTRINNLGNRWFSSEWSIPSSGRFNRGRQRTVSWVGPRFNLDTLDKRKTSCCKGKLSQVSSVV